MSIKLMIADDHPLIISGLQNMLRHFPDIEIVGTFETGKELLEGLRSIKPDVLLLDIQMPDKTGTELAGTISKNYPDIRIIALTVLENNHYIKAMLRNGASGYLLKNSRQDVLIEAINAVYVGEQYIEPSLKDRVWRDIMKSDSQPTLKPILSKREKEVLQLIADEYTSQEIADKLFISLRTVESHRLNLLLKLGMKNMAGLVKVAVQMGLVE